MADSNGAALVLRESQNLIQPEDLLRTSVQSLDDGAVVTAWSVLDLFTKEVLKKRMEELKTELISRVEETGDEATTSSGLPKHVAEIAGAKITSSQVKQRRKVNEEALKMLLLEKRLPAGNVLKEKVVYEVDEKALEGLVAAGFLSEEELSDVCDFSGTTHRLVVKKSKEVQNLIKSKG